MPKTKIQPKEEELDETEKIITPDVVIGEEIDEEKTDEDEETLDDEEIDPFKDKWEE